ncbi:MAG: restriction endonuclease, partial [Planctomycetes bacterium]|nr:restriction endonuclease [Planctomycetota bacterium]
MPEYDFATLSPHDFEILSRDLLQKEWNVTLESFKSGRDSGIDLRYSRPENQSNQIVQCKHYYRSGFSKLKSALENVELPKIKTLNPTRYVLTTSVSLSPSNKEDLLKILAPYCQSLADIIGQDDLNNLLGKHEVIERRHFKLWLPSTEVLHRLLHNGVFTQSALEIDDIKRQL